MCKINQIINYKGVNYKRVSKAKLESMLNAKNSITFYALPCKANIFSEIEA